MCYTMGRPAAMSRPTIDKLPRAPGKPLRIPAPTPLAARLRELLDYIEAHSVEHALKTETILTEFKRQIDRERLAKIRPA
jgi:hypothetical protein